MADKAKLEDILAVFFKKASVCGATVKNGQAAGYVNSTRMAQFPEIKAEYNAMVDKLDAKDGNFFYECVKTGPMKIVFRFGDDSGKWGDWYEYKHDNAGKVSLKENELKRSNCKHYNFAVQFLPGMSQKDGAGFVTKSSSPV